ncbi:hypothetical protein [Candidatus Cyanaurora vandensis]|nr:hypothetical protein [Candidatus Cyanaurora vandensis]
MKIPFLSLAPISGLLFIVASLTIVSVAIVWANYPLFYPLVFPS